jgi:hypothetical protein
MNRVAPAPRTPIRIPVSKEFDVTRQRVPLSSAACLTGYVWALTLLAGRPAAAQPAGIQPATVVVHVNGAMQNGTGRLDENLAFTVYGEGAAAEIIRTADGGMAIDVGGYLTLWRQLVAGATYSQWEGQDAATLTAQIPHPLLRDQPRLIDSRLLELAHRQRTMHTFMGWTVPVDEHVSVILFGGPSFFNVTQEFVSRLRIREHGPPFLQVELQEVETTERGVNGVGINMGADIAYRVAGHVGVGFFVRWAIGSVDLPSRDETISLDVGGLQTGGGLRVMF